MPNLEIKLDRHRYQIHIDSWNPALVIRELHKLTSDKVFIITNATIAKLYRSKLNSIFRKLIAVEWIIIPDGERYKTLSTCERIHVTLSRKGAHRKSVLVALGGGVVGDITGFVAATYMRGIRFVQMPTTLLAQVDSSVGGKTGVDLPTGKNLVGAFHQPHAVFIFTDFLKTLPKRELSCGLAEVIKYGIIQDEAFLNFLSTRATKILNLESKSLQHIIFNSCRIKARIVELDEKENNLRAVLNFGHTLGHALETATGYKKFKHGEAVALGMLFALSLSYETGLAKVDHSPEITLLLNVFGLPTRLKSIQVDDLMTAMKSDKKKTSQNIRFILVGKIGTTLQSEIEPKVIRSCLQKLLKKSQ